MTASGRGRRMPARRSDGHLAKVGEKLTHSSDGAATDRHTVPPGRPVAKLTRRREECHGAPSIPGSLLGSHLGSARGARLAAALLAAAALTGLVSGCGGDSGPQQLSAAGGVTASGLPDNPSAPVATPGVPSTADPDVSRAAAADVTVAACGPAADSGVGPVATLKVTNHSAVTSDYLITVDFDGPDGRRLDVAVAPLEMVAAGQRGEATAQSFRPQADVSGLTCKVAAVDRRPA